MFRTIREISRELQGLRTAINAGSAVLVEALSERTRDDVLQERLDSLEAGITLQKAEADAQLMKAESVFRAARASEERGRHHAKKAEEALALAGDEEGMDPLPEWYLDQLRAGDDPGGPSDELPPVRSGVESRRETVQRLREMKLNGRI